MINPAFQELALVVAIAGGFSVIARWLKQPTIIAYIATGILIGPIGLLNFNNPEILMLMSEIGITLLLFLIGLEMNVEDIKHLGKTAAWTGIGQIIFTTVFGFVLASWVGFEPFQAFYVAIALTFSSTIIIVKLLSEKKELSSLHGKIAIGFLLVQDFVAILLLIILAGLSGGIENFAWSSFGLTLAKAGLLFYLVWWFGREIMPSLVAKIAKSTEVLFLFSVAWALGIALLISSKYIGFSIEIGGFLAGLALANSSEHFQIDARIKPLRDFFVVLFFISLGSTLVFSGTTEMLLPAILLSLFVLIGNPLIVMIIMGLLGYKRRTSFMASLAVAQISEFSLIVMALGGKMGHVSGEAIAIVTIVGVITILASSYLIMYSQPIYEALENYLKIFERKKTIEPTDEQTEFSGHTVLVGAHRLGQHILGHIKEKNLIIVDYNPNVIKKLLEKYKHVFYGDIIDPAIQNLVNLEDAKLIISTIPDINGNVRLLDAISNFAKRKKPYVICIANTEWEAKELYELGANYVLLPHFVGGKHLAHVLNTAEKLTELKAWKRKDLKMLQSTT